MNKKKFTDDLETWISENINKNIIRERGSKIIRDPVHGINQFTGWEVNFIDLPIIQRLRYIKQNSFAFLVYPGAVQNRFDHTLGVSILTRKFIDSLLRGKMEELDEEKQNNLRLAAIFHDIGHGPFSHLTEEIYSDLEPITDLLKEPKFSAVSQNVKSHEILSYYIVKSENFKMLFEKSDKIFGKRFKGKINVDLIAECIIGNVSDKKNKYCQDIINGSFDADKLDYILRDCYFTGLKMGLDIERIFSSIIPRIEENKHELALDISGCHNLEQLLFNKLLLFPSLYHHHKVRACNCMFKSIFEIMYDHDLEIDGKKFDNPIDFLESKESLFLTYKNKPKLLQDPIKNLLNRALLKKALVIAHDFLKGDEDTIKNNYLDLIKWNDNNEKIRDLRELISDDVPGVTKYDVWIDLPKPPSLIEASQCNIKIRENEYETLDKIFPSDGWLTTYHEHKWRGFIFCPPKKEIREKVQKISRKLFSDEFGIELTEDCVIQAKIR